MAKLKSMSLSSKGRGGGGGGGGGGRASGGRGGGGGGIFNGGSRGGRGGMHRVTPGCFEVLGDCFGLVSVGVRTGLSLGDRPIPRSTWNPAEAMGVSIVGGSFTTCVFSPETCWTEQAHKHVNQQATDTLREQ